MFLYSTMMYHVYGKLDCSTLAPNFDQNISEYLGMWIAPQPPNHWTPHFSNSGHYSQRDS